MSEFSISSKKKLSIVHPRLRLVVDNAIKIVDFTVLCGHRDQADQDRLFAEGKTKLKFPDSKHNLYYSEALDLAPLPIDWDNISSFYYLAGVMMACACQFGVKIRWGGDWDGDGDFKDQNFNDLVHFELDE